MQTGFGRTGTAFWGFENHGVSPDIVTMAKGIGNGAPLACCVTKPFSEVAQSMTKRLHFNTYGGNPVSMAQGLATLDVILEEKIQQRAKDIGGYLKEGLQDLQKRHAIIGDIRGQGLMLGVELVEDRKTKTPAPRAQDGPVPRSEPKTRASFIGKGGLFGNVLRIKPPMCLTRPDVDFMCQVLDIALGEANGLGHFFEHSCRIFAFYQAESTGRMAADRAAHAADLAASHPLATPASSVSARSPAMIRALSRANFSGSGNVRARILSFLVFRYSDPAAARREQAADEPLLPTLDPALFEVEPPSKSPPARVATWAKSLRAIHQSNFDNWRAKAAVAGSSKPPLATLRRPPCSGVPAGAPAQACSGLLYAAFVAYLFSDLSNNSG